MRSRRFLVIRASCTANLVTTDSISFELSRGRYTTKQKDVAFDLVSGLVWVKSACLCALVCDQYHLLCITIWSDCCKKNTSACLCAVASSRRAASSPAGSGQFHVGVGRVASPGRGAKARADPRLPGALLADDGDKPQFTGVRSVAEGRDTRD